jgi:hypothetical protein
MDVKGARVLAERIAAERRRQLEAEPALNGTPIRCVDCGGPIATILVRLGSVSCHDCRSGRLAR